MESETISAASSLLSLPSSLRVISLNCWGLKYLSKHRHARLVEIGHQLVAASPTPSIVGLQEVWTQEDFQAIHELTKHILPHAKFYFSGCFGGGLAILSKWPIEESTMYRYPLNGRPAAFYRGDWFVGKGVAAARMRIGPREKDVLEVFCTHLHAPYEEATTDSYLCHRTAQAWEIAKMMRHAAERGHLVLGLGDFNMVPLSLAHRLIEAHAPVRDVWRVLHPDSAVGSADSRAEKARGVPVPSAEECLRVHGATCDGKFNTWRWSKQMRKDLGRGKDSKIDPDEPDRKARRLDYVFVGGDAAQTRRWEIESAEVGMTMRHPTLRCSLSDHFSVESTLVRRDNAGVSPSNDGQPNSMIRLLPLETYDTILTMITKYSKRERLQRKQRLAHFWIQVIISLGCFVAVWWSPHNYVAFILMLLSTLGFGAGVIDGLIGLLFYGSEIRALKEFEWEIREARREAKLLHESGEAI